MHGSYTDFSERLYLQKGSSGDISVPCGELTHYQIDGVRFLFSQYKKEKPGVILNYPPGCGNSVQVAVYISAISEKLKRPVLILYEDGNEKERWLERFSRWTDIKFDSIEVDTSNPFLRKAIFISSIMDIGILHRRYWGIIVVKSDIFLGCFQNCMLKVDYKIWITAQDLKKNKLLLRSVISWIYPLDPLLHQYLDNKPPAMFRDEIPNDMLLELLLEDILFTRRNLLPLGAQKRKQDTEVQPPLVITKKNKDATGKKIKRSKKPPEVSSSSEIKIDNVCSLNPDKDNSSLNPDKDNTLELLNIIPKKSNGDNATAFSTVTSIKEDEPKMDVESFIRDNEPLISDSTLNFAVSNLDDTPQVSDTSSPKVEEESTESSVDFACAVDDIVRNENDICTNKSADSVDNTDNKPDLTRDSIDDIDVKKQIESQENVVSITDIQEIFYVHNEKVKAQTESKQMNVTKTETQEKPNVSSEKAKEQIESKKLDGPKTEIKEKSNVSSEKAKEQIESKKIDGSKTEILETHISNEEVKEQIESKRTNGSKTEIQETPYVCDEKADDEFEDEKIDISKTEIQKKLDFSDREQQVITEIKIESQETGEVKTEIESTDGEGNGAEVQKSKLEVSSSVKKETEKTFDEKMQEFEEKALKKYKGSALDNIF